jgi:hypothetical protein
MLLESSVYFLFQHYMPQLHNSASHWTTASLYKRNSTHIVKQPRQNCQKLIRARGQYCHSIRVEASFVSDFIQ